MLPPRRARVRLSMAWLALGLCLPTLPLPDLARAAESDAVPLAVAPLPAGVRADWDSTRAFRTHTPTRERISLNGLWRWQPILTPTLTPTHPSPADPSPVPTHGWGHFKVPGAWPGLTDYLQKDCQTVFRHPAWNDLRLGSLSAAWYEREFSIPADWSHRRVELRLETLHSFAEAYVDDLRIGELRYPEDSLELPAAARTPGPHRLALRVVALPLKGVLLSYTDSASARTVQGTVARRGLCGDAWLISTPTGPRIADVQVQPSVRDQELRLTVALDALAPATPYRLRARVVADGEPAHSFASDLFRAEDLVAGRWALATPWTPKNLWDTHTPTQRCRLELTLVDAADQPLDAGWPVTFGFREFWIEGRDFILNGTRLHLSAVPLDNAQVGAAWATYDAARESLLRLQSFGINYVYTHNYGCEPGSHLAFDDILRAADDTGMLVGFSQPHFSHYEWAGADADRTNGYQRHAAAYVRIAQNHPSVVMYAMSHNATGYDEDMNPDLIDGLHDARDRWALRNVQLARRAEAIVHDLDPGRIIYHHASGNLGPLHVSNFYPNFAPVQELSDWFEHWAGTGVKPLFTCEYGAPFSWDWTLYRGWFNGEREFGSAKVPWQFCLAEWNAQFLGDAAYQLDEPERANLRWEAAQFRKGTLWHRWDYPHPVGSPRLTATYPIHARYLTDNWRAFRTWGVSAISPWDYGDFWRVRSDVDRRRRDLPVDWSQLQRPGFSPDYLDQRYERFDLAFERGDWQPTVAATALLRNNRPLLAYLGGGPDRFTTRDHVFLPGETVRKQIILLNDSRLPADALCRWSLDLPQPLSGRQEARVAPGNQVRLPLACELPATLPPGRYTLRLEVRWTAAESQADDFTLDVLPPTTTPSRPVIPPLWLYDPPGETRALLDRLGVSTQTATTDTALPTNAILVIGRRALTVRGPAPDFRHVRDGLRTLVFEQTPEVLADRLGFRVTEYGLRDLFARVPDHPALAGLAPEHLHDWRGAATLLPPRLKYELQPRRGPTVTWNGLSVPRVWRCGNQGNLASVLIEKPGRGDFLPLLDGGFGLQYSPLLEYREGRGVVLFCQADVTGRTQNEPAADLLVRNVIRYLEHWLPAPPRSPVYAGPRAGHDFLGAAGIAPGAPGATALSPQHHLLILAPPDRDSAPPSATGIDAFLAAGGRVLALGQNSSDTSFRRLAASLVLTNVEHLNTHFPPPSSDSPFAGINPADLHNRDPRPFDLVAPGADADRLGDGILAAWKHSDGTVVLDQFTPWSFDATASPNQRRTYRRAAFALNRLLANLGVAGPTPLLDRLHEPPAPDAKEPRWKTGYYWDLPEEWDDPYRFFRW